MNGVNKVDTYPTAGDNLAGGCEEIITAEEAMEGVVAAICESWKMATYMGRRYKEDFCNSRNALVGTNPRALNIACGLWLSWPPL
ncbi:MAG: hypothetical protein ABSF60_04740 [Verrucomicrobiota bacterium]